MLLPHTDRFRAKLAAGQTCLGTVITFTDATVTEALCQGSQGSQTSTFLDGFRRSQTSTLLDGFRGKLGTEYKTDSRAR